MLKSILDPHNNFKFNVSESIGDNFEIPIIEVDIGELGELNEGNQDDTSVNPENFFGKYPISIEKMEINRTEEIIKQLRKNDSPEALAANEIYLKSVDTEIIKWQKIDDQIQSTLELNLKFNLERAVDGLNERLSKLDEFQKRNEINRLTGVIIEKIHKSAPDLKIKQDEAKEQLTYLYNEKISGRFLKEKTQEEIKILESELALMLESYQGTSTESNDKIAELRMSVMHLEYPSTKSPKVDKKAFYRALILFGPKNGINEIKKWKQSYIEKNDQIAENYHLGLLTRNLQRDFAINCEKYPILKDAFLRILKQLTPKEIGLTTDQYETFIQKATTNIKNSLKYLAEQNETNYCPYNLNKVQIANGRQEVRVDGINGLSQNSIFRIAISSQVSINSITQKEEYRQINLTAWNIENGENIKKAVDDFRSQPHNSTQTGISELRTNQTNVDHRVYNETHSGISNPWEVR
jgi:hypothetical protein